MPRVITRVRIINRKTSKKTTADPAQSGAHTARLNGLSLTITGIRNQEVFKQKGVLAARWEDEETILLVVREEEEDEPVVIRAFRSRTQRLWETEDAHAIAHVTTAGRMVAVEFSLPNAKVAILPLGRAVQEFEASINLGAAPEAVEWSEEGNGITITTDQHYVQWAVGKQQFKKSPKPTD